MISRVFIEQTPVLPPLSVQDDVPSLNDLLQLSASRIRHGNAVLVTEID